MTSARVFFYVQHLWGVGHVYRATRIAKGLAAAGFDVHLVWGGTRLPGFDFSGLTLHELPPVRTSDASFSQLLHSDSSIFTDEDKTERLSILLALFDDLKPNILMTEAFPFGRRQMRFELLPLLDRAKNADNRVIIVASIRDIMQEDRKLARVEESNALVAEYFDYVFVHGDPELIRIEETLQGVETFVSKIRYTGLVTPDPINDEGNYDRQSDVLVSVGGGAFGKNLLETALKAADLSKAKQWKWLITTGTELAESSFNEVLRNAPGGVKILRHLPNLQQAMQHTQVSVSHAGYNTVADILRAGCASVLYPYTGGRETEQLRRATMMQELELAQMIDPDSLSALTLVQAIEDAMLMPSAKHRLDLEGAKNSARILLSELETIA